MDLISPGLKKRRSSTTDYLNGINSTNIISIRIEKQFKELNTRTINFLSKGAISYAKTNNDHDFIALQSEFQSLIYLLGIDQFDFKKLLNLNLSSVLSIYKNIENISIKDGTSEETLKLINEYVILLLNMKLSDSLIYKTLYLKSQSIYWENLNSSSFKKYVYFIQSCPIKIFDFSRDVLGRSVNFIEEDESYVSTTSGTEEDNLLYNSYQKVITTGRAIFRSFKQIIEKFVSQDPSLIFLNMTETGLYKKVKYVLKYPLKSVNREVKANLSMIEREIDVNAAKVDMLIKRNSDSKSLESVLQIQNLDISSESQKIGLLLNKTVEFNSINQYLTTDQPGFMERYWPLLIILIIYGPSTSINVYKNRDEIINWVKLNLVDTVIGFFENWVINPINGMLKTLRRDDDLSITSKESLKSDLDSLERMVTEFIVDQSNGPVDKEKLHQMIQDGDLTMFMSQYENEIRTPVKSIVRGSLIRSILIQVQKTKVDGAIALSGIDKLLKSQQLVFGVVSISPSLFILYKAWSYLTASKPLFVNGKELNLVCLKSLNTIESLLIDYDTVNYVEGRLLIEISNLMILSKRLIPNQLALAWSRDLTSLNDDHSSMEKKMKLISKIWNVYGPYFR
ncbi:uncharacterized protein PRCAT00005387001 [Priceomyces carsonii]|uniref:uncharacterized protein n=1 Tax=Priceomyces carsonii TaxID=28549 RepID=UPI002ED8F4AD|nr:unnamed protein product [Priceomyces carsonii]